MLEFLLVVFEAGDGGTDQIRIWLEREGDHLSAGHFFPIEGLGQFGACLCEEFYEHLDPLQLRLAGVGRGCLEAQDDVRYDDEVDIFGKRFHHEASGEVVRGNLLGSIGCPQPHQPGLGLRPVDCGPLFVVVIFIVVVVVHLLRVDAVEDVDLETSHRRIAAGQSQKSCGVLRLLDLLQQLHELHA